MKFLIFVISFLSLISCSKIDKVSSLLKSDPIVKEDSIKITVTPDISVGTNNINKDSLSLIIYVNSNIPALGLTYSLEVKRNETNIITFKFDSTSLSNSINVKLGGFTIKGNYTIKLTVTSKSNINNSVIQNFVINRNRIYKNYLKTSYELSNFDSWFSSAQLYKEDGSKYNNNPFIDEQSTQLDIDGDGQEDVFYYEGYDLNINPTPNPPPSIFMNNGLILKQTPWVDAKIKEPHGTKILIGDFNNDSLPDLFSLVAVDPPNNSPAGYLNTFDFCNLLINSPSGFTKEKDYTDQGFWYSGCSGDIDNDGDLDIIAFNFHNQSNGVKSRIMWNDGNANFTIDFNGIGDIPVVDQSELVDINNDGFLDLVINFHPNGVNRINDFRILYGNGKGFSLINSSIINISGDLFLQNLDFVDIDGDGVKEIIPSGNYINLSGSPVYFISFYKSYDKGKIYLDKSNQFIDYNTAGRFYHIIVQDIDKNGLIDIFSSDKKDNIRWEWNGSKFIKK